MRSILAVSAVALVLAGGDAQAQIDWGLLNGHPARPQPVQGMSVAPPVPVTTTCFIKGEQISGQNKLCFYDCLGSGYVANMASYDICQPQIQR